MGENPYPLISAIIAISGALVVIFKLLINSYDKRGVESAEQFAKLAAHHESSVAGFRAERAEYKAIGTRYEQKLEELIDKANEDRFDSQKELLQVIKQNAEIIAENTRMISEFPNMVILALVKMNILHVPN